MYNGYVRPILAENFGKKPSVALLRRWLAAQQAYPVKVVEPFGEVLAYMTYSHYFVVLRFIFFPGNGAFLIPGKQLFCWGIFIAMDIFCSAYLSQEIG